MNVPGTIVPACNGIVKWFATFDKSRFSGNLFLSHEVGMYRRVSTVVLIRIRKTTREIVKLNFGLTFIHVNMVAGRYSL